MRKINESDFVTTRSNRGGYSIRWKHNNRVVKHFSNLHGDAKRRAKSYIKFLVKWYNKEGYRISSKGGITQ